MRRNILRRTISEDLVFADGLRANPDFEMFRFASQMNPSGKEPGALMETRS